MQTLPQPLKIVAWLFIIGGALSVLDTVIGLFMGRLTLSATFLGLFIGLGLLRLDPRSLAWAKFATWLGLIFLPIAAVAALFLPCRLDVFGVGVGQVPHGVGFLFSAVFFAVCCWQYDVLTSNQTRQSFFFQAPL